MAKRRLSHFVDMSLRSKSCARREGNEVAIRKRLREGEVA
jgi:hypothetical protein